MTFSKETMSKVYLDSSIYIYAFEDNPKYYDLCSNLFQNLSENNVTIVSSPLTLAEILSKKGLERNKMKEMYLNVPNLYIKEFDLKTAELTSLVRIKYNLKMADAIHVATAIAADSKVFITNDKELKRVKEIKVKILYLDKLI